MKKTTPRIAVSCFLFAALALLSGCASFVEGLNLAAHELQNQQARQAYYDYYGPRPASDTSAPGIK